LRRVLHLEEYLQPLHFRNLGLLLLAFALLYLYFNVNEYLTMGYKFEGIEKEFLTRLFFGDYAPFFWTVQAVGVFIPTLLMMAVLGLKRYQQFVIPGVALAAFFAIVGAWAKRYLIVVPTLSSPFLPGQRIPWEWSHYRPTWVEWSITAAAVAVFLLIYALFSKLFPMISVWETREVEAAPERVEPVTPATRRWGTISSIPVILVSLILVGSGLAHAGETRNPKKPMPTTLSLESQAVNPGTPTSATNEEEPPSAVDVGRVHLGLSRIFGQLRFGAKTSEEEKRVSTTKVKATLKDANGAPVSYQPVSFSLHTSFGNVQYGSRPTNEQGTAELMIRDERYGSYPVSVSYGGNDSFGNSSAVILVDFGGRPVPALPKAGILIAPYATPSIGLPFVLFYGSMWVVYLYAFGYLIVWRMRRAPRGKPPS
jgi:Big-like domain-containing protein